jgi:hypothetical protein
MSTLRKQLLCALEQDLPSFVCFHSSLRFPLATVAGTHLVSVSKRFTPCRMRTV